MTLLEWEMWWEHCADRSVWELEHICMKGKCVICKMGFNCFENDR